jgi:hypothetical protein
LDFENLQEPATKLTEEAPAIYYAYKASLVGAAQQLELTDSGLSWRFAGRSGVWRYADIAAIRLSYRPVSMQARRFRADLQHIDGGRLAILSTSWQTAALMAPQDNGYRSFMIELHRRMEKVGSKAELTAGLGRKAYLAALALVALVGQTLPPAIAKGSDPLTLRPIGTSVVEAERFVLRDPGGRPRATMAVAEDGTPLLIFLDRDGEARGVVGPKHLVLSSDDGASVARLLVNPAGTPALRLEKDGRLRAVLGMSGDGTLALGFYGQDGKGRALLDVGADGSPGLTLFSKAGTIAWSAP